MTKPVHVNFVKLYCTAEIQQDLYAQKMGAGPCRYLPRGPAGPGFTVKRPIRKEYLGTPLHSLLILVLLASRIWRALHESVNFVHDPEKQYKSLSVAHRPGGTIYAEVIDADGSNSHQDAYLVAAESDAAAPPPVRNLRAWPAPP